MLRNRGRHPIKGFSKTAEMSFAKRGLSGKFKLNRCLKILRELEKYDEAGGLLLARNTKRTLTAVVLLFLTVFALPIVAAHEAEIFAVALACISLILLISLVYLFFRGRRLKRLDLADDFRKVLIPILIAIQEDIPTDRKIKLNLDLAGPSKAKVVRDLSLPRTTERKIQETTYLDQWCHLEAPLISGSQITLNITNTCRRHRIRWKKKTRNGGTKYKTKTKWKKLVVVRAEMCPDATRFCFDPSALEQESGRIEVRMKKRVQGESAVMKLKRKFKSQGSDPPTQSVQPKEVLAMFLQLRSMFRPVSTVRQRS